MRIETSDIVFVTAAAISKGSVAKLLIEKSNTAHISWDAIMIIFKRTMFSLSINHVKIHAAIIGSHIITPVLSEAKVKPICKAMKTNLLQTVILNFRQKMFRIMVTIFAINPEIPPRI